MFQISSIFFFIVYLLAAKDFRAQHTCPLTLTTGSLLYWLHRMNSEVKTAKLSIKRLDKHHTYCMYLILILNFAIILAWGKGSLLYSVSLFSIFIHTPQGTNL